MCCGLAWPGLTDEDAMDGSLLLCILKYIVPEIAAFLSEIGERERDIMGGV